MGSEVRFGYGKVFDSKKVRIKKVIVIIDRNDVYTVVSFGDTYRDLSAQRNSCIAKNLSDTNNAVPPARYEMFWRRRN